VPDSQVVMMEHREPVYISDSNNSDDQQPRTFSSIIDEPILPGVTIFISKKISAAK
jgi:hypothetical protein